MAERQNIVGLVASVLGVIGAVVLLAWFVQTYFLGGP